MPVDLISLAIIALVAAACPILAKLIPGKLIPEDVYKRQHLHGPSAGGPHLHGGQAGEGRRGGTDGEDLHTLYLAGGCFWGLEAFLKRLPGVRRTVAGYANGSTENPSYRDVCNWNTGHAETVAVTYDRRILPTDVLLDGFFEVVDPTSLNRQGNDAGTQYRSGIYWLSLIHI